MVEMYVKLITEKEDWTIERVPARYREQVKKALEA